MPAVPTLGVKLHTNTQYGRNQLASRIGVHNLSIYLISLFMTSVLNEVLCFWPRPWENNLFCFGTADTLGLPVTL